MSSKVWSTALAQCRRCAGASSQTISFASWSSSTKSLYIGIEHIESLPMVIGILKIKCEVHPPSNRRVVMSKEVPRWRRVCPVEPMPITCYIQRFCLTHLDRLRKILRLRLGLLCWTLQWQFFLGKCWAAGDSSWRNHGVCLYHSQVPQPIEDWHAAFLQAAKRVAFPENHASHYSSTLIWP